MTEKKLTILKKIIQMDEMTLFDCLYATLANKYEKVIKGNNYIYAVGDTPIALIAHLDTVFPHPPKNIYCDEKQGVLWSPEGMGADDRAGVYAILDIIIGNNKKYRPSIIFTLGEEIGAVGAQDFADEIQKPLSEIKYIIELDRHGEDDCVFYSCDNRNFVEYIEKFGFKENIGSYTDISQICPVWGIAGVNLSIGYEHEHSYSETLFINLMEKTIEKVINMIKEAKNAPVFAYIPMKEACDGCHNLFTPNDLLFVESKNGRPKLFCIDCCVKHASWCYKCGHAFETDNGEETLCEKCKAVKYSGNSGAI